MPRLPTEAPVIRHIAQEGRKIVALRVVGRRSLRDDQHLLEHTLRDENHQQRTTCEQSTHSKSQRFFPQSGASVFFAEPHPQLVDHQRQHEEDEVMLEPENQSASHPREQRPDNRLARARFCLHGTQCTVRRPDHRHGHEGVILG